MSYVDAVVIPVPESNRGAFAEEAKRLAGLFLDCGATEVVDGWGADVPDGEVTSLPMAVKLQAGERVALGWIVWPSKSVRDAGWEKALADPRMGPMPSRTYDGRRMIFGGFDIIQSTRKGA